MLLMVPVALFWFGAVLASFIGVVAARLYTGQGFLAGRSHCDACGAVLPARSLIPLFAFASEGGHARCCGARISWHAPAAEVVLGALFVLAYLKLGLTPALPLVLAAFALLLLLVVYDLMHQILPPVPLGLFVASSAAVLYAVSPTFGDVRNAVMVAAGTAFFLWVIHAASRGRAMGLADVPLVFGLSLLTGPAAVPGFVFSFWIGAVVGITLLLRRPLGSTLTSEVPFAPFLAAGFLLAYFTQWNPFAFAALLY